MYKNKRTNENDKILDRGGQEHQKMTKQRFHDDHFVIHLISPPILYSHLHIKFHCILHSLLTRVFQLTKQTRRI